MLKKSALAALALLLLTSAAFCQEGGHFDVSLNFAGILPKQASGNGIVQAPTKSAAFLATARWRFNARHSVEANYARGNDSQIYTTQNVFRIQSNITELSGAYVFTPIETPRLEPFVFGGAGALVFNPFNTFINTIQTPIASVRQTEFAVLYGGGVDYKFLSNIRGFKGSDLVPYVALRFQYRGLFYKAPSFKNPTLFTGGRGHLAEAAIGLVIKF
ncbi:MAG: outer membrane beta-barrel protein [Terriglobales bacterium]